MISGVGASRLLQTRRVKGEAEMGKINIPQKILFHGYAFPNASFVFQNPLSTFQDFEGQKDSFNNTAVMQLVK